MNNNLSVNQISIPKTVQPKVKDTPTNHVFIVDVSGSMAYDLPKIREQLKHKIPKILKDIDTLSIIWFSGKGQSGTLIEAEPVATLADLQQVNQAIDRWLKPVGLTGFKDPLDEATALIKRIEKKHPGAFSLIFQTDGCDNQWSKSEILKACENTAQGLAAATFVEYGYYADRPLLTAMAEKVGGNLIFAEDFDRYAPLFENAISKTGLSAKRIDINIPDDPICEFAFAMVNGDLLTFSVNAGVVSVPEGLDKIYYVATTDHGSDLRDIGPVYAAISLYSIRMKSDVVLNLLSQVGDVAFVKSFGSCYGKQRYSVFMDATREAAFDKKKQLTQGFDPRCVPPENAFTVLQLLQILNEDDNARLLLDHESFKYSKISRSRVDADSVMSSEELDTIKKLTDQLAVEKDAAKAKELTFRLSSITASKQTPLKFEAHKIDPTVGYSISNLTYNEERPNISLLVRKEGTVDISSRLAGTSFSNLPEKFPTFIYRNYAVVKDGLINFNKLPVRISTATFEKIRNEVQYERLMSYESSDEVVLVIDLSTLPIINRQMVKDVSAKTLFNKQYELLVAQANQKVTNAIKKELYPGRKSEGFAEKYGAEATAWLKELGFTDYSGFGPKQVQAEARDYYIAKSLEVSLKGLSSLPSLKDVRARMASGKMTPSASLMVTAINLVDDYVKSHTSTESEKWLNALVRSNQQTVRRLIAELAMIKFSIIVGQVWPLEWSSLDENTLTLSLGGKDILCTLSMNEVKIEI